MTTPTNKQQKNTNKNEQTTKLIKKMAAILHIITLVIKLAGEAYKN